MATFFLDFLNGNDTNDGTTFANRWKTITTGATAARIAPGDLIKMIQSPDPTSVGNVTWTKGSASLTLAGALTANIDLCDAAWTAATNVTSTTTSTRKQGTVACSLAIAGGFGTGKIAHKDLGSVIDFSAYQQVSFWFRTSSLTINGTGLTLRLCSDTTGDAPVNTITVPTVARINTYQCMTVDTAGALGSNINSISLAVTSDPVTPTILIDNILACKASSSADSLTLKSLMSKNLSTESWYCVKNINGTAVEIDMESNNLPGSSQGYHGTTETVTTYKREPIEVATQQSVQDDGTAGNLIHFQGGWDSTNGTTLVGQTWLTASGDGGIANFNTNQSDFVKFSNIGAVRAGNGIVISAASNNCELDNCYVVSQGSAGFLLGTSNNQVIGTIYANNNNGIGVSLSSCDQTSITEVTVASSNASTGITLSGGAYKVGTVRSADYNSTRGIHFNQASASTFDLIVSCNNNGETGVRFDSAYNNTIGYLQDCSTNGTSGVLLLGSSNNIFYRGNTSANVTQAVRIQSGGRNFLRRFTSTESTKVTLDASTASILYYMREGDSSTAHTIYMEGGSVVSDTTTRHTASGISWRLKPTSTTTINNIRPITLSLAKIAVDANATITVKAYFQRDNSAITGTLVCRGRQIAGVDNDVTASLTTTSAWEQLSISFTPTEKGAVEIIGIAYGGTTNSVYIDDLEVTSA